MRLTEIMSAAHLDLFAQIGLILFLAIFCGVLIYTFARKNQPVFERAATAPLDDAREARKEPSTHD